MTNRFLPAVIAGVGFTAALLSVVAIPWAQYGDMEIPLWRFPAWSFFVIGMIAVYCCAAGSLIPKRRVSRIAIAAVMVSAAFTIAYAAVLMSRYADSDVLFSGPIPMVVPRLGIGGPIGVIAALTGAAAAYAADRSKRHRKNRGAVRH
jgi:hypothetical protein